MTAINKDYNAGVGIPLFKMHSYKILYSLTDSLQHKGFFYHEATALLGQGRLIIEDSRLHSDTPHSVGLLWTSDQLEVETSTWQHTTLTRDKHPHHRRDLNLQSQQTSGRRPTALDRAASGIGNICDYRSLNFHAPLSNYIPQFQNSYNW
jgi:hypothetical protein